MWDSACCRRWHDPPGSANWVMHTARDLPAASKLPPASCHQLACRQYVRCQSNRQSTANWHAHHAIVQRPKTQPKATARPPPSASLDAFGRYIAGTHHLRFDPELGLIFEREESCITLDSIKQGFCVAAQVHNRVDDHFGSHDFKHNPIWKSLQTTPSNGAIDS